MKTAAPAMRVVIGVLLATLIPQRAFAQTNPNFSGVWMLDTSHSDAGPYGQIRVIWQNNAAVDFTAIQYAGAPSIPAFNVIPWKLRFNRWGPRRGGENSLEPKVQARWDGNKLIYVKSPGESFSVLFIWSLEGPDELLVQGVNWTYLPDNFDFKERSIPSAYVRFHYVYRRVDGVVDWTPHADGKPITIELNQDELNVSCHMKACLSYEIRSGRRTPARSYGEGSMFRIPLDAQTTVEFQWAL